MYSYHLEITGYKGAFSHLGKSHELCSSSENVFCSILSAVLIKNSSELGKGRTEKETLVLTICMH